MKLRTLLSLALLAPAVALAAPASGSKSSSAPSSKSSASAAKPEAAQSSGMNGLELGGFIGYETDDLSGLALRLDGELPFRELSPQVKMSFVGSLGYSYLTWEPVPWAKISSNVIKVVPAARFTLPLNPQFSVFGDAGLGLAYVSVAWEFPGTGLAEVSDSSINIMMRLGAGAWYHVNPQLKVGGMLEFDPIFGDFGGAGVAGVSGASQSTFNILVGAMFQM